MNALTHSFDITEPYPCDTAWSIELEKSWKNEPQIWDFYPQKWDEDCLDMKKFVDFMKAALGTKPEYLLADLIGYSHKTTRNWLDGSSCPKGEPLARIISVFGPIFIQVCFTNPPAWAAEAERREKLKNLEAEIASLESERIRLAT